MAKVKVKRKPFWRWVARALVNLANRLSRSDHYVVFRCSDEGRVFSRREVEMTLCEWASNMKCALVKRVLAVRASERVATLYVDEPSQPILPSRGEVSRLVDEVVDRLKAKIDDEFDTPEKLEYLKVYILPVDVEILTNIVRTRVETFREYNARITSCMAFLKEVQSFRSNLTIWKLLVPVQNDSWNADALYEYLDGIDIFWLEYADEKSVANLVAFYNNIGEQRRYIQTYFMQLYPSVKGFECKSLLELIKGARALKYAIDASEQPVMGIVRENQQEKQVA